MHPDGLPVEKSGGVCTPAVKQHKTSLRHAYCHALAAVAKNRVALNVQAHHQLLHTTVTPSRR